MKKREKKLLLYIILFFIIGIVATFYPEALQDVNTDNENISNIKNSVISEKQEKEINIDSKKLNILYLDVGQADSQLIFYKNKLMIIDTGNVNDGEKIVAFLKEKNITTIDYLIGTHIHEDHIGSMQYIVKEFNIGKMYLPYNESNTSIYYKNLLTEVLNKNLEINELEIGNKINIEDLECEVMAVDNSEQEDANDASIVLEMTYKKYKFLFTGDATKKVENSRGWKDIDVLKVGHHGSDTSSSKNFIDSIKPEISIISVGEGNNYNLPKESIIKRLEDTGSKVYRTDKHGTIQIIVDENMYEIYKIDRSFDGNN